MVGLGKTLPIVLLMWFVGGCVVDVPASIVEFDGPHTAHYGPCEGQGAPFFDGGVSDNDAGANEVERPDCDMFGVARLNTDATDPGGWDSLHWHNGTTRTLSGQDLEDVTGWSSNRGTGSLKIDGQGILTISGKQPRLYVTRGPRKWKNVEATVYYMRIADDNTPWGGAVIGARSGRFGHTREQSCTATTYYGRLRHDGYVDFDKELQHPASEQRARRKVWDGGGMPYNRWIGLKFVVRTEPDNRSVRLSLYRDLTNGKEGGQWMKLTEYIDAGGWAPKHKCSFAQDMVITEGGGVVFLRNTGVLRAKYKWLSVREIGGEF